MDKILFKKINLLIYLAGVDGKFDLTEKKVLIDLLTEHGLDGSYLETHKQKEVDLNSVTDLPGKTELFYWILRLIKADNILHPDEIAYSKALAVKLNIKMEAVDHFAYSPLPSFHDFAKTIKKFQTGN